MSSTVEKQCSVETRPKAQWFWAQFGPIWVQTKYQPFSFKIVSNAQIDAYSGKLLAYDVFCTPKARVIHAFSLNRPTGPIQS